MMANYTVLHPIFLHQQKTNEIVNKKDRKNECHREDGSHKRSIKMYNIIAL